ncbi:MAG: TldD/PmbA family protein [Candidatus Thorarchaeota archaeon]
MDSSVFRDAIESINLTKNDFADIRGFSSKSLNFSVRKGNIEQTLSQRLNGVAIRVMANGAWGFCSTEDYSLKNLKKNLERAYKLAYLTGERIKTKINTDTEHSFIGKNVLKTDLNPQDVSIEEKYAFALEGEKILRNYHPEIVNSTSSYEETIQREIIVNSNGTEVSTDYGIFKFSLSATSRRADIIQNVKESKASNNGLKSIFSWDIQNQSESLAKRAITLLDAQSAPKGRHNILMEPSLVGVYIHEAFGHASEGDAILNRVSVLRDKVNANLGIDSINVYDDPTIEGLRGSYKFDSEGTPAIRRNIVQDGNLISYLNSLETSKRLSLENPEITQKNSFAPNGAGRAQDFRHVVMPRMSNTYIDNGDYSFDELLEAIKNGIYLQYSYGGYVNPVKGEFLFSSQSGYLIENGELTKPIRNSAMSGMTLEVLKNTIALGKDLDFAFPGTCGKPSSTGQQNLPVTAGGPHLAVKSIIVGGI